MTMMLLAALIVGAGFGAAVGHVLKPRKSVSPKTRDLLHDMARAINESGTTWHVDKPNILNDDTKQTFRALLERYHREIDK